jgi:chemotaxis protein MotB
MTDAPDKKRRKKKDAAATEAPPPASSAAPRAFGRRADDVGDAGGAPVWLLTFTDVMALMLTFFVLLFTMTVPTEDAWDEMIAALQNEFNSFYGAPFSEGTQDTINLSRVDFDEALNINYLASLMEAEIKQNENLANIRLIPQSGQLIVALPSELLFEPGDATVKTEGSRALYALGGILTRIKNKVEIVGHADPRPIEGENRKFGNNWELSMARAGSVAAILNNVGYNRPLTIRGRSSGRYQDLQKIQNMTDAERLDLSRRVDIVVLDNDGRKDKVLPDLKIE